MRLSRLLPLVAIVFLAGCLNLDLRVKLFQDGTGTYTENIEFGNDFLQLVLNQTSPYNSFDDLLADAASKTLRDLEGIAGVRLIDMRGEKSADGQRIIMVYGFDSIADWNVYAQKAKKPQLAMTGVVLPQKKKLPAMTEWTITYTPADMPIAPPGEERDKITTPEVEKLPMKIGEFQLTLAGPVPMTAAPSSPGGEIKAENRNGEAVYFGAFNEFLGKKLEFAAKYTGEPLPQLVLEAAKKQEFAGPSDDYKRILDLVAQLRERQAVQDAATAAIRGTHFLIHLTILPGDRVQWETARAFYGPGAVLLAGREAMLQAMLPEAAAAYRLSVEPAKSESGADGVAFVRRRNEPLKLAEVASWLTAKRDGEDTVYVLQINRLLDGGAPENPDQALGEVIVVTAEPVIGTNGEKTGPSQARFVLTAAGAADGGQFIVRTTKAR